MKHLSILGSTGSIGTNCLQVVASKRDEFDIRYLTTFRNAELLLEQAKQFQPEAVAIFNEEICAQYESRFRGIGVAVYAGFDGILEISKQPVDIVVNALVGAVGLEPTLHALRKGQRVALANKETLVLGGQLVMAKAKRVGAEIIPIDSEHSALFQCMVGETASEVRGIILTASGGPFRTRTADFSNITVDEALDHPNWVMGPKISVDSATLMNKGLEVIEAFWLFGLDSSRIKVVTHPQSIIHSLVEFADGSVKAQLGMPDMRVPIQYALTYPRRLPASFPRLDLTEVCQLTFEKPDFDKFRCLRLAFDALEAGGGAAGVLNAANEEAVKLFLNRKIGFHQIPTIIESALRRCETNGFTTVEELLHYDQSTREYVLDNNW